MTADPRTASTDRIAVMTYSFAALFERGQLSTAALVPFLGELGVAAIEIRDQYLAAGEEAAVRAALSECGLAVAAYDLTCDFVTLDRTAHRREIERARVGLARAAGLGATQVLVVPGELKPEIAPETARSLVSEGLQACLAEAARLGLGLSIENLGYQAALCGRVDHLESICRAVGPATPATCRSSTKGPTIRARPFERAFSTCGRS